MAEATGEPSAEETIAALEPLLLPRRVARMRRVLATRSAQAAFVFERMVDPHNLSAVLRSLDAFSFQDVHLVGGEARAGLSRGITQGTERWLSLHEHPDMAACVAALHAAGYGVLASHVAAGEGQAAPPLTELDFTRPLALVFGNEHAGVSAETLALADGTFRIDMLGFVESFNLSVAAALTAFHARRELDRLAAEAGDPARFALPEPRRQAIYAGWLRRSVRQADRVIAEWRAGTRPAARAEPARPARRTRAASGN